MVIFVCLYMCRNNSGGTHAAPGAVVVSRERSSRRKVSIGSERGYGETEFSLYVYSWMEKTTLMYYLGVQFGYNYMGLNYWHRALLAVTITLK